MSHLGDGLDPHARGWGSKSNWGFSCNTWQKKKTNDDIDLGQSVPRLYFFQIESRCTRPWAPFFPHLLQASCSVSHMHDCRFWVSQYGTHWPLLHLPLSMHSVPSAMGLLGGQAAWSPVQTAFSSQVAKLSERHFAPAAMKLQPNHKKWWYLVEIFLPHLVCWLLKDSREKSTAYLSTD